MNPFESKLLRLREWLEVKTDTEAFQAMGLTRADLIDRRKRGVFPGDAFLELCEKRQCPALKGWVYYGCQYEGLYKHKAPVDYETRFPSLEEMSAFMDAEMARMGIAQGVAA